jgi:hypothetical protein
VSVLRLKPAGYQRVEIAIRQQVAGELLDGELVEGKIAIERRSPSGDSQAQRAERSSSQLPLSA